MVFDFPYFLKVYLTNRCNLNCRHCYKGIDEENINYESLKNLLPGIASQKVQSICLTGGEPLLYRELFSLIKEIKSYGIHCQVASNGVLLNSETIKELEELKLDSIQISLDGHTQQLNDVIRGNGTFHKIMRIIPELQRSGIHVIIGHTANNVNFNNLDDMVKLCEELNVDLRVELFLPLGTGAENSRELAFTEETLPHVRKIIREISSEKIRIEKPVFDSVLGCGAGSHTCIMNTDFTLSPCDMLSDLYKSGAVQNINDFKREWQASDAFAAWRNIEVDDGYCLSCQLSNSCGYGCRASALAYRGSISQADSLCVWRSE